MQSDTDYGIINVYLSPYHEHRNAGRLSHCQEVRHTTKNDGHIATNPVLLAVVVVELVDDNGVGVDVVGVD